MNKETNASDFKAELESLAEIEVLENEEMAEGGSEYAQQVEQEYQT